MFPVQASPEALCCVLEQDLLSSLLNNDSFQENALIMQGRNASDSSLAGLGQAKSTVNSEILARILFSRIS